MLTLVVSGGQTGVDQSGLRAARRFGIPTGGYAPRGWLTEAGPAPWLGTDFGLVECPEPEGGPTEPLWQWQAGCYRARTRWNAAVAGVTLWLGKGDSSGFGCTAGECRKANRPIWSVPTAKSVPPGEIAGRIEAAGYTVLNVAGNRESKAPGIQARAEQYLCELFRLLGHSERTGL